MKKIFALAAVAVLALASCSNNTLDPQSQKAREINFSTVTGMNTKAPISGTTYKTTDPHFGIFAYALAEGETWAANSGSAQLYMDNVEIKHSAADSIWCSDDTYYWPLSGSLTFIGYSPYGCNGTVAYTPATKVLTVTDFAQAEAVDDQEDLMWATTNPDLTDNQSTYTDENSVTSTKNGVNEVFHHALSQVKFNVKKAAGLEAYTLTVNSITFKAYNKGTLTVTNDSPAWSAQAFLTGGDAFDFDTEGSDVVAPNNTSDFAAFGVANMPVPQTLATGVQTFTITYSLEKGGVDLGQKTVSNQDLLGATVTAWAANTIYNYNIVIDLNKIYFNPTVDDWTTGASQSIDVH